LLGPRIEPKEARQLSPLEAADQPVVGDPAVVLELLPAAAVHLVVDDVVAEGGTERRRSVEAVERLAQRFRALPACRR
jgi:hypothetical protein